MALHQQEASRQVQSSIDHDKEESNCLVSDNLTPTTSQHDIKKEEKEIGTRSLEDQTDDDVIQELKHLQKRIRNIQESIKLSSAALCSPKNWEKNCLCAVKNCVNEWTSIVSFYDMHKICSIIALDEEECVSHDNDVNNNDNENEEDNDAHHQERKQEGDFFESNNHDQEQEQPQTSQNDDQNSTHSIMHPESEWSKTITLEVFGLIQLSMQCGPLKGSNAGYFKRCGSDVARLAYHFLMETCAVPTLRERSENDVQITKTEQNCDNSSEDDDSANHSDNSKNKESNNTVKNPMVMREELRFTQRQEEIIQKWIIAAKKAMIANKAPSKSALKLQEAKGGQKMKKQKMKQKKRLKQQKKYGAQYKER